MHNFISVLAITMFGKSDLSIRVADKMDKLDRTWELFANSLIRISIDLCQDVLEMKESDSWLECNADSSITWSF